MTSRVYIITIVFDVREIPPQKVTRLHWALQSWGIDTFRHGILYF